MIQYYSSGNEKRVSQLSSTPRHRRVVAAQSCKKSPFGAFYSAVERETARLKERRVHGESFEKSV